MAKAARVVLRGRAYRVVIGNPGKGFAGEYDYEKRVITISETARKDPETWVHEFLHALYPDLCEEAIDTGAKEICTAIARCVPLMQIERGRRG